MKTSDRKLYPKASWATYFGDDRPGSAGSMAKSASGEPGWGRGFSAAGPGVGGATGAAAAVVTGAAGEATGAADPDRGSCCAAMRRASSREKAANLGSSVVVTTWV